MNINNQEKMEIKKIINKEKIKIKNKIDKIMKNMMKIKRLQKWINKIKKDKI
jgi:hypothetical protein